MNKDLAKGRRKLLQLRLQDHRKHCISARSGKNYPNDIKLWPTTVEEVDRSAYLAMQNAVKKFIREKRGGDIVPVQFDDIYWTELNWPSVGVHLCPRQS